MSAYGCHSGRIFGICGEIRIFAKKEGLRDEQEIAGIFFGEGADDGHFDFFRAVRRSVSECLYSVFGHCMVQARQFDIFPVHGRVHCGLPYFSDIEQGMVFEYQGHYFIRIESYEDSSFNQINAVDLETGENAYFQDSIYACPRKGQFVVE